jgi:hypothetical protein
VPEEPMLKLWPNSSHVAGIDDPLVISKDAMHRNTSLIPVFSTDFWVDILVECIFYLQDVIHMVRTNLLLCQIDLEHYHFCRYLDNTGYLTSRFDVK